MDVIATINVVIRLITGDVFFWLANAFSVLWMIDSIGACALTNASAVISRAPIQ
ncbi:hypothetical protein [Latilactobacillus sakei]|uniref:hypothetical protein n=1 Tax=Latilactobacillus sakei TaxID=1599 RepID=UPI003CF45D4C